jgi:hypothetical protein
MNAPVSRRPEVCAVLRWAPRFRTVSESARTSAMDLFETPAQRIPAPVPSQEGGFGSAPATDTTDAEARSRRTQHSKRQN